MSSFADTFSNPSYIQGLTIITTGQAKGLLYVESPNDIGFWRYIVERVCPGRYEIKAASKLKANGKRTLEPEYSKLHKDYIVGVDGDMDYLCPLRNSYANELNGSVYILHTFSYAKESLQCSLEAVEDIMNRLIFDSPVDNEIARAMSDLSHAIYDAVTIHLYRHNSMPQQYHDGSLWPLLKMPSNVSLLNKKDLTVNISALNDLRVALSNFIQSNVILPQEREGFDSYVAELTSKGLTPLTAYQFIKGHVLHDNYVFPMLRLYRNKIFALEMARIGSECKGQDKKGEREVRVGEVNNFFNKTNVLETLLNNTFNYTNDPVYCKIEEKLRRINL